MALWHAGHWQAHLLVQSLWGIFAFCYALNRRAWFWLRLLLTLAAGMLAVDLLSSVLWEIGVAGEVLTITALYLILIGIVFSCHKVSVWTAMFMASSGYIAQDIASRFKYILRLNPWIDELFTTSFGVLLADLVCYGGIYLLAYFFFRPYTRQGAGTFDDRLKAIFSVLVLAICVGMSRLAYSSGNYAATTVLAVNLYQILCGGFILIAQYGVLERANLSHRIDVMRELLHQQKVQYETSKENAQLVNEKYHDLKKMLSGFRGHVSEEALDELERHIGAYDTVAHTGSEVLDVVLAEKRMQCAQRGIQITCYANGAALDFVEELNLYALLNNALTNAMEATEKLPEGERFITLTVVREGDMTAIHVENSCDGEVELADGLPKSRRDPLYHGFGMKSMARTAEKYGGSLAVKCRDRMFNLDVILFAPEGK